MKKICRYLIEHNKNRRNRYRFWTRLFDVAELLKPIVAKNRFVDTIRRRFEAEFETPFRKKRPWLWSVTMYLIRLRAWARARGPAGPVRRCVFNYSIIHPAIHHQPSVKFILFLCIGPLQFAAPCINLLLVAICLARAASNPIVLICRVAREHVPK